MIKTSLIPCSSNSLRPTIAFLVCCWICASGCATQPYRYSNFHAEDDKQPDLVAFEYGQPQRFLDDMAWFTGIWSRILTLNSHVNNHELTEETKQKLICYLQDNDLEDVLIRVNQYDPKGEWKRLRENKRMSPVYKYTTGAIGLVAYTIFPGRVFGGDEYNPYTNSLYINSDVAAIVLHEAAYAKDIHARSLPGTYAFINDIPMISLWRHTNGINEIVAYAQLNDDWNVESETYKVIYPQMGIYSTAFYGAMLPFWDGLLLSAAGATAGHVTGRVVLTQRKKQHDAELHDLNYDSAEFETVQADMHQTKLAPGSIQVTKHETESDDDDHP